MEIISVTKILRTKLRSKFELDRLSRAIFDIDKAGGSFTVEAYGHKNGLEQHGKKTDKLVEFIDFYDLLASKIKPEILRRGATLSEIERIFWV